jgi:hypothetical protein
MTSPLKQHLICCLALSVFYFQAQEEYIALGSYWSISQQDGEIVAGIAAAVI